MTFLQGAYNCFSDQHVSPAQENFHRLVHSAARQFLLLVSTFNICACDKTQNKSWVPGPDPGLGGATKCFVPAAQNGGGGGVQRSVCRAVRGTAPGALEDPERWALRSTLAAASFNNHLSTTEMFLYITNTTQEKDAQQNTLRLNNLTNV